MSKRIVTEYTIRSPKINAPLDLALVTDLHNAPYADMLPVLRQADAILIGGDLVCRYDDEYVNAVNFLRDASRCAPVFYAVGNHEWKLPAHDEYWPLALQSEATILDNAYTRFRGIVLGGFSSAPAEALDASFLQEMAQEPGFRLLMCHHPEHYAPYVQDKGIDLTVAGHAHGGQIQLFGRGLYAPGQGILPKLTHGLYDNGRLLVSRGMTNACRAPRWWNPCELVMIHLRGGDQP